MTLNTYIERYPLFLLHLFGWSVYIAADYLDHIYVGNYDFIPTLVCGVAAWAMTGLIAIAFDRMTSAPGVIKWTVFVGALYAATVIWHKILIIFHHEDDSTVALQFEKVRAYDLADWIATGFMPIFMFLAWAAFYFLAKQYMARRYELALLQEAQLMTKKAQLETLRHQLNPHFLFNILNSIDVSIRSDDKETAHRMTQHLSRFLRSSLEHGDRDKVPLGQELSMLTEFVAIEQIRFRDQLSVDLQVPPECEQAMIPAMLLQPLMENAVKFAWSQQDQGHVELVASRVAGDLAITITNSKAASEGRSGTGTGLRNTKDRLKLLYGDDASVAIQELASSFTVTLNIPWEVAL